MTPLSTKNAPSRTTALRILPQLVPGSVCLRCDVCCRFADPDSALRPYFTGEEIDRAVHAGLDPRVFSDADGCQIALVPDAQGAGFLCPAFQRESGTCRIYDQRPLDCELYPLALMWNATHDEVLLGWDAKCPFLHEVPESIRHHAERVREILDRRETVQEIAEHPRLVGRFQEDVVQLASLHDITQALRARWGPQPLRRLMVEDLGVISSALDRSGLRETCPLAAYSTAYHYIWNGLLPYWWTELRGALCLFIESPDGWFMPLPPLTDEAMEEPLREAFRLMRCWNGPTRVSRVENVSAPLARTLVSGGFFVKRKDCDYLYRASDLAALKGDRYKSQRALCNRVENAGPVTIAPYEARDLLACRKLFQKWSGQKHAAGLDSFGVMLLEDMASAHEVAWSHASALQLSGQVLRVKREICAYTFGHWLNQRTWCVLLEVADRTIPGLAQYLFRDSCRKALAEGAEFINTMDDSGLSGLRLSKEAYHPVRRVESFICTEGGT